MYYENALDVLYRLGKNLKAATGVDCIDRSLKGGFEPEGIYELVGDQAVGKTQILYGVASSFLRLQSGNAAWIDINGSFVTHRFLHFLGKIPNEEDCKQLLSRIYVTHAFDALDIIEYLKQILSRDAIRTTGSEPIMNVIELMNKCASTGMTLILTNHLISVKGELMPSLGMMWRKQFMSRRYLVGKDSVSCYFRATREENEDFKTSTEEPLRFSILSSGISDYDDFL